MKDYKWGLWFGYASVGVMLLVVFYCTYLVISGVWSIFDSATDPVKATSITALVTVTIFILGRYFEQARERKSKVNLEKIAVYKKFFDFYFDIMTYSKIHGKEKESSIVVQEMLEFQKEVVFWGSDAVLKAYLDFKDASILFSGANSEIDPEVTARKLAVTMKSVAILLVAMRKDIGYSFTRFSAKDLARLQLANDPETQLIMKYL